MSFILGQIITGVRDVYSLRYSELASSTIVVFDHLITLDDEIELVWKSSWSIGKMLFIINRYYTLASVIANNRVLFGPALSTDVSLHFFRWQGWTGLFAAMIAEIILQMRLYALYFLDKKVLRMMVAAFIATSATSAAIMGVVLSKITVAVVPLPVIGPFCAPVKVPDYFYTFWIPILSFETLLCFMAITKGIQTFRTSGPLFRQGRQLVGILIRDSIVYFFVMFATYLTCLLVWVLGTRDMLEIPIGFSVAMSCVLGNRVILNVRAANRDIAELESKMAGSKHHTTDPLDGASTWKQVISKQSQRIRISSRPVVDRMEEGEVLQDDHIDTLTDIEMEQLRTMRADTPTDSHQGFIVI
ncbi:hypothetical protein K435DRAFT_368979 [Dendrothele bispora CBS 962.96]|uniref:DUF6533 domain-containing protein n=1 Tax=Dendrothele bispora (strain CBS 962.96) TaxID=1314807 RepID=A0A4S8LBS1_DENBC|nr:hypothetical protein K435DRAFT_368979 [Dendrothele bispora CBS 962.96]